MVSQDLIDFMRGQFGSRCLKVLNDLHQKLGIDDVEESNVESRKNFILELQPMLREKSFSKSEIMISELMSILDIKIQPAEVHHLGIRTENKALIRSYVETEAEKKIKYSFEEMNSLTLLYLAKTKDALKQKIHPKAIESMTSKVLMGLKHTLLSVSDDIENKYNVRTSLEFINQRIKELEERGDYMNEEELKNQKNLAIALDRYHKKINTIFDRYYETFIYTLRKKIKLEKEFQKQKRNFPGQTIKL